MTYAVSPVDHCSDASFPFSQEISKPFGRLDCILEWCRNELCNDWRWQLIDVSSAIGPGRYIFYFDSERDAVAFALMWL